MKSEGFKMKCFIDCGARIGESIERLLNTDPDAHAYNIHMFEPNPVCYDIICANPRYADFTKHKQGVSDESGIERLWGCVKTNTSVGSTMEISKAQFDKVEPNDYLDVEVVDLSNFLFDNFKKEDYIILKLNIEGAEYRVLEGLLKSGACFLVQKLFVDFHTQWLAPEYKEREIVLRQKYAEINLPLLGWNY
jgi:FkbM family methyltransferase